MSPSLSLVQPSPASSAAAGDTLDTLLDTHPAIWRGHERERHGRAVPSGFAPLDDVLPGGGWAGDGVTELLTSTSGIGELTVLLPGLRRVSDEGGWIAFIDPPYRPYAPALVNAGLALERLLVVDAGPGGDGLWATEQLLRTGALGALVLWAPRTTPARQRRLQLAAESGACWTTVYRPLAAREDHSPVAARIAVAVADGRLELDVIKARGGRTGTATLDPSTFDAAQGSDWPLAPRARGSAPALSRAIAAP